MAAWDLPPAADPLIRVHRDAAGARRTVSARTAAAVMAAMGLDTSARAGPDPVCIGRAGERVDPPAELLLEDGTQLGSVARLPRDLPHGYHALVRDDGQQRLLTPPRRCQLALDQRRWAWAIQLYATRSRRSWGIGDLADLRTLARWSAEVGAEGLLLNPIGAPNPAPDPEASPYYPSSRRFRDPLMVAVDELVASHGVGGELANATQLADLGARARALNAEPIIDRSRVQRLKLAALEGIWASGLPLRGRSGARFEAFRAAAGAPLSRWATFALLSEVHGSGWPSWPAAFRDPGSASVARAAEEHADRVAFHAWVQFVLDEQLGAAGAVTRLISDLPIGFDPGGFDAWEWQRQLAPSASIGAPPDPFNAAGQDWGLPPFIPHRLRQVGHQPFIETIRSAMRHAGGVRIDHVLGLFRLWWIPEGMEPWAGAYVRYPSEELLAVLAIESERNGALVIGEDLGTIEPGVRRALAARNVLSTRLVCFERNPPSRYPRASIAAITTHDLPTLAGLWTASDLDDQRLAGLVPDRRGLARLRERVRRVAGLAPEADAREALRAAHDVLAAAPSVLVSASFDDALGVTRRPNMPGTGSTQRPNWSIALPVALDELMGERSVRQVAGLMRRRRRAGPGSRAAPG